MNCKPGNLAAIVRVFKPENEWMLGRVIRCVELQWHEGIPGWRPEEPLDEPNTPWCWHWVADRCLMPLDGGGITDDEVRDLYAPTQPEIDERFAAAHYQDGRDLSTPKRPEVA